jgi:putative hydrolases of HD superfamily
VIDVSKIETSSVQQIVVFILELDKLKGVTRKTQPLGLDRYENSVEHSWQIDRHVAGA